EAVRAEVAEGATLDEVKARVPPKLAPRYERAFSAYGDYRPWRLGVLANIERTYAMVSWRRDGAAPLGPPPGVAVEQVQRGHLVLHEVGELTAKLRGRQVGLGGEARHRRLVGEVVAAQTDHVAPGDRVARGVHVHHAHPGAAGGRVEHLGERDR